MRMSEKFANPPVKDWSTTWQTQDFLTQISIMKSRDYFMKS